jgi:hypothetical protein
MKKRVMVSFYCWLDIAMLISARVIYLLSDGPID